jgi:hypothetical protein
VNVNECHQTWIYGREFLIWKERGAREFNRGEIEGRDGETKRQRYREIEIERETEIQRDREIERQRDRDTER